MRALHLLPLFAACQTEWIREYDGAVPHGAPEPATVLLVRDHRTGLPVEGAVVRQCPEYWLGPDAAWAPVRAERRTDEFGLVAFPLPEDPGPCHWTVHAPGYAPTEVYGNVISEVIDLRPPVERAGRLLGIDGAPLGGVLVEWKLGCAHAPALATARTRDDGAFVFDGIDDDGDFTIEDPRFAADYWAPPMPRPRPLGVPSYQVLPGQTIRGRVMRGDGTPPEWAAVLTSARGPRAAVGRDGSFSLHGYDGGDLLVRRDDGVEESIPSEGIAPGLAALLVFGHGDRVGPQTVATVRLVGEAGERIGRTMVHFDRIADGRRFSFEWSPHGGALRALVAPGAYLVSAGDAASSHIVEPERLEVTRPTEIALRARRQPTLSFDMGDLAEDAPVVVRIVLGHESWPVARGETTHLPASGRAWLRIDLAGTPYTFPIGPVRGSVRRAEVRLPGRKRIRVPDLEDGWRAEFLDEENSEVVEGDLTTYSVGRRRLSLAHAERGWAAVEIDLPWEEATVDASEPRLARWPAPAELRVVDAGGAAVAGAWVELLDDPVPFGCLADDPGWHEADATGSVRARFLREGIRIRVAAAGFAPLTTTLRGAGPFEARFGSAAVEVEVPDVPDLVAVVDGEVARADEEGRVAVRGLRPGPHTLVVGAPGRRGVACRIVLAEGETRRLTPDLRPR